MDDQVIRLDLMLADYAVVQGGKLFISGAGIDTLGAADAVEGGHGVTRACSGAGPFGVDDGDSCVGLAW